MSIATQIAFDIDAMIHEADIAASPSWSGAPLRFHLEYRTSAELDAAFDRYVFENGNFNCLAASHMWHRNIQGWRRVDPTVSVNGRQHTLAIYNVDLRCDTPAHRDRDVRCSCVSGYLYRAHCDDCLWMSQVTDDESDAAAEWHDHAMPGWRELPIVPEGSHEMTNKEKARRLEKLGDLQPAAWQFAGAPIITDRRGHGTRAVEGRSPYGGYDFAIVTARPDLEDVNA